MIYRVIGRILEALGVLLLVSFFVFSIATLIPGDLSLQLTGVDGATEENIMRVRAELGLDRPFIEQYLSWIWNATQGNFGNSPLTNRAILGDVNAALPVSLQLALFGLIGATIVGAPIGVFAAVRSSSRLGQLIRTNLIVLLSVPSFVVGALLVFFSSRYFPQTYRSLFIRISDNLMENLKVMFLPSLALSLTLAGVVAQVTRNALIQELNQPYVLTARAYGFSSRKVVFTYALRGAVVQILTVGALLFGSIVGGTVITERVFALPGIGNLMVTAIGNRDFNLAIVAILYVTVVYLILNTFIDLAAEKIDPRIRNMKS